MPKFYPSQAIIDDVFAKWIYDEYRADRDIPIPAIKDRQKYLGIYESFKIVSECPNGFGSEQRVRDKAKDMLKQLEDKFNKEDYPELWV